MVLLRGVCLPGSQHAENYYFWVDPPTLVGEMGNAWFAAYHGENWDASDLGTRVGDIWWIGDTPMRWTDTVRHTGAGNVATFWIMKP